MIIVSPSLLSCDFLNIESELKYFDDVKDFWFHLDIMDGHFVPNLTFGHPIVKLISKNTNQKLDAHFMVTNPEFYVDTFKDYNIHNFTFHVEACEDSIALVKKAKEFYPSVGVSLRPGTSLDLISDELLKSIDLLLVMSVEPGFGGQGFMESTWERLKQIRERQNALGTNVMVQIDGGVSDKNATSLIEHGANNLVAGSYVFKGGPVEYLNRIKSLRN
ncbi:MAG: ribulose-phosphate 3-epimerase [Epsilonproteobacteria bacterium]|nr:MAG: ribulose-phosphate 3-epimerase [Campylobacterota bacterium]RLA67572.1 MAG: ribulose-phosphate 3-epimerase [Campylobacterota bacterium]